MPTYAIGDVQGCFRTLLQLLKQIDFLPGRDTLWLLGDLVGRGADAPAVLRFVHAHPSSVHALLGNHDLALLAFAEGLARPQPSDKLDSVLKAKECSVWLAAMRARPLLQPVNGRLLVHAGLLPSWTVDEAMQRGAQASIALQSRERSGLLAHFLRLSRPNEGNRSKEVAEVDESLRVLTCVRALDAQGRPEADYKGTLADMPANLRPWFRAEAPAWRPQAITFGHWSALGLHQEGSITALDGGCVWGRSLCAQRLDDGTCFSQPSAEATAK